MMDWIATSQLGLSNGKSTKKNYGKNKTDVHENPKSIVESVKEV